MPLEFTYFLVISSKTYVARIFCYTTLKLQLSWKKFVNISPLSPWNDHNHHMAALIQFDHVYKQERFQCQKEELSKTHSKDHGGKPCLECKHNHSDWQQSV